MSEDIHSESEDIHSELECWADDVESSAKWIWNAEREASDVLIPFDLWERLGQILGHENEDPRAMGWVNDKGLP